MIIILVASMIGLIRTDCSGYRKCTDCSEGDCGGECFHRYNNPLNFFNKGDCNWRKVHGAWSGWSSWQSCPVTCGSHRISRSRYCNMPSPQYDGNNCYGNSYEQKYCATNPCPINGEWSGWSTWSNCTAECGYATRNRSRLCDDPQPEHGGLDCIGSNIEIDQCDFNPFCKGCDVVQERRVPVERTDIDNDECLMLGFCFAKEKTDTTFKCYMKKGPNGQRSIITSDVEVPATRKLGDSVSRTQCILKCKLTAGCEKTVFVNFQSSTGYGECYVSSENEFNSIERGELLEFAFP